jgi:hypothetical protein
MTASLTLGQLPMKWQALPLTVQLEAHSDVDVMKIYVQGHPLAEAGAITTTATNSLNLVSANLATSVLLPIP